MKLITIAAIALSAVAEAAFAENWVTVYDDDPIWATVDADSVHRGDDGLVYFQSEGGDRADQAADCERNILYTIKIYAMDGLDIADWREKGQPVVSGSAGEAILRYACAH